MIIPFPDLQKITLDKWDHHAFREKAIRVDVLRLDKIHPVISGNKWFKLKYYLDDAHRMNKKKLISFGGAYSNHLIAVAAAAKLDGFSCQGFVRGDKPHQLSHTLVAAESLGMDLQFLSREEYDLKKKAALVDRPAVDDSETMIIPEGGAGLPGVSGSAEILSLLPTGGYSHICCAVGTGTTIAGIINSSDLNVIKIGVSVLKGTKGFDPLNISWIKNRDDLKNVSIIHDDHFGGYAKKNDNLLEFMNHVFKTSGIPTDFVYTGKLFYSILRLSKEGYIPRDSHLLIIHSGGLQGNHSLPNRLLEF
jgi:1-aminocyclopropane-1-carboxylate deaminase